MEFIIKDNKNDKIISSAKTIDELSDGYHTFKELYDFRREYNAALVNTGIWKTAQHTTTSRFLSLQDEKRAKEFLESFRDLIEKAGDLI